MKHLILISFLFIVGCATSRIKDVQVVEKYKYVIVQPDQSLLQKQSPIAQLDINNSTDQQISKWIVDLYDRTTKYDVQIDAINKYLKDVIDNLKIPKEDVIIK